MWRPDRPLEAASWARTAGSEPHSSAEVCRAKGISGLLYGTSQTSGGIPGLTLLAATLLSARGRGCPTKLDVASLLDVRLLDCVHIAL